MSTSIGVVADRYRETLAKDQKRVAVITLLVTGVHLALLLGFPKLWRPGQSPIVGPVMMTRTLAPVAGEPATSPAAPPAPSVAEPAPAPVTAAKPRTHPQARPKPVKRPLPETVADSSESTEARGQTSSSDASQSYIEAPPGVIAGPANYSAPVVSATSRLEDLVIVNAMKDASSDNLKLPRSVRITYVATGTLEGKSFSVPSTLNWRHDDHHYNLTWDFFSKISNRRRWSHGIVTEQGIAPVQVTDLRDNGGQETRFDYANRELISGTSTDRTSFQPGTQDVLSAVVQMAAMVAAKPASYTPGTKVIVSMIDGAAPQEYAFVVQPEEVLTSLQGKSIKTLPLLHEAEAPNALRIQLWLAPSLDYMPARWRVVQDNGDTLDQLAQNAYELTVPGHSAR